MTAIRPQIDNQIGGVQQTLAVQCDWSLQKSCQHGHVTPLVGAVAINTALLQLDNHGNGNATTKYVIEALLNHIFMNTEPILDLSGSKPGVLDASQPSRILRRPNASLSFAAYDPLTAIAPEAASLKNLSISENASKPAPHKMIVVETVPDQGLFWRFVPKARLGPGVVDEGTFPRVVNLCGCVTL